MFKRWYPQTQKADSFELTLNEHLDLLYRVALRLTKNPQEAEDLCQEVVLSAWRGREGFTPGTSMRAWLLKILNNQFIDMKRNRSGVVFTISRSLQLEQNLTKGVQARVS